MISCLIFIAKVIEPLHALNYYKPNASLVAVPNDIPLDAVNIYLRYNMITQIGQNDFLNLTIERLELQGNRILQVSPLAARCTNLQYISLSFNLLTYIPVVFFQGCDKLTTVALSNNNLTSVDWLKYLGPSAEKIYINRNQISSLPPHHFSNLAGLQLLSAEENNLNFIDISLLRFLPSLTKLQLQKNFFSHIDDPYQWCRGVSCTTLKIWANQNQLKCDSSFCWDKYNNGITLFRDWCFSKPWNSVTKAELACKGMLQEIYNSHTCIGESGARWTAFSTFGHHVINSSRK